MTRELRPEEEFDEGYWTSLGAAESKFSGPPPGHDKDPFAEQDHAEGSRYAPVWLQSYRGIEFIDVFIGDFPGSTYNHELVFLYRVLGAEEPKCWNLGRCPSKDARQGTWIAEGVTYEEARTWAEQYGRDNSVDAGGAAEWRLAPAGEKQVNLTQRIGLWDDGNDGILTKGQASDLLNRHFGSQTLDPAFTD